MILIFFAVTLKQSVCATAGGADDLQCCQRPGTAVQTQGTFGTPLFTLFTNLLCSIHMVATWWQDSWFLFRMDGLCVRSWNVCEVQQHTEGNSKSTG